MRLGITIAMSCGSLAVILVPLIFPSLKLEHGLQKHVCSVTEIKYGFVKLAVIFWLFKLQQTLKSVLNCCQHEILLNDNYSVSNSFHYKDPLPNNRLSGNDYKFQCGLCNEY